MVKAKSKSVYFCQSCGFESPKWLGRCTSCNEWNSFAEEKIQVSKSSYLHERKTPGIVQSLADQSSADEDYFRIDTGIDELNRVLGGGLVSDSFVLIGGDPGIGKSTLLLQMVHGIAQRSLQTNEKLLYVSGEESIQQIRARAQRLGVKKTEHILLSAETRLENALESVAKFKPKILVMDSLQTFSSSSLESAPGSVTQVREVASRLMSLAKTEGIAVFIVGHVTKEGGIAGPKIIEHMVDTVLYFEGDRGQNYRLLRTVKNRFGSTRELGVFEMDGEGLKEVSNPSSLFLSERQEAVSGTAIGASLEGSRPLLVEFQALVAPSPLNFPRRTSVGLDASKISLLAAILERHLKLKLAERDLFFNVAGGLRLAEPACDLAAAAAIWSSYEELDLPRDWVFMGEVGLTGEIRNISQAEVRVAEAKKLGFKSAIIPWNAKSRCEKIKGIELITIQTIGDLGKIFLRPRASAKLHPPDSMVPTV